MAVRSATTNDRHDANAVRHLDQRHLAARWGLSARTLERWRSRHQGPAFLKLGGRIAYRIEDIEAYEAAQRRETNAA